MNFHEFWNIDSMEKHAKTPKSTYNSLQFPAEMNITVSKTLTTFISFRTDYDYRADY